MQQQTNDILEFNTEKKNFFYSYNQIFDLDVSEHAKIIYLYFCRLADNNNTSFPAITTIGKACGISRSTVKRAIVELMEIGLLVKVPQKNGRESYSNRYIINSEPSDKMIEKNIELGNIKNLYINENNNEDIINDAIEENIVENDISIKNNEIKENLSKENILSDEDNAQKSNNCQNECRCEISGVECKSNTRYSGSTQNLQNIVGSHRTPLGSQRTYPGSHRTYPGSHRTPKEYIYINNIYINYISSSSLKEIRTEEEKEKADIVFSEMNNLLDEALNNSGKISIGNKKYLSSDILKIIKEFTLEEFEQVVEYLNKTEIHSMNAVKIAILNAHRFLKLNKTNKNTNKFKNFEERKYDFKEIESKLVNSG